MVKRKTLLTELLSAHIPLKRVRHLSSHDDVTIGLCSICRDDISVPLSKIDKKTLEGIFFGNEIDFIDRFLTCQSCLFTLKEYKELKLYKIKIEKRIDQIRSCIRTLVLNKISRSQKLKLEDKLQHFKPLCEFIELESIFESRNHNYKLEDNQLELEVTDVESEFEDDQTERILDEHQTTRQSKNSRHSNLKKIDGNLEEAQKIKSNKGNNCEDIISNEKPINHPKLNKEDSEKIVKQKVNFGQVQDFFNCDDISPEIENESRVCDQIERITKKLDPGPLPEANNFQESKFDAEPEFSQKNEPKSEEIVHECNNGTIETDNTSKIDYNNGADNNSKLLCNNCDKKFSREYGLIRHLKNKVCSKGKGNNIRKFSVQFCDTCNKGFLSEDSLKSHVAINFCVKPENLEECCGHCGKKFPNRKAVVCHLNRGRCRDTLSPYVIISDSGSETDLDEVKVEICEDIQDDESNNYQEEKQNIDQKSPNLIGKDRGEAQMMDNCDKLFAKEIENHSERDGFESENTDSQYEMHKSESDSDEFEIMRNRRITRLTRSRITKGDNELDKSDLEVADALYCKLCRLKFLKRKDAGHHVDSKVHKNMVQLQSEERNDLQNNGFKCARALCGKSFVVIDDLISHLKVHKYKCESCFKSFLGTNKFIDHLSSSIHNRKAGPQPELCEKLEKFLKYPCTSCSQRFVTKSRLKQHFEICTNRKRKNIQEDDDYKSLHCDICKTEIIGSKAFQVHLESRAHNILVLSQIEGGFKCNQIECGLSFPKSEEFIKHFHKDCKMCKVNFTERRSYLYHLLTERHAESCGSEAIEDFEKLKKKPCSLCDKKFVTSHRLREHQKTHKLSFTCEICGKSFCGEHPLKLHQKTHKEKPPKEPKEPVRIAPPKVKTVFCKLCGKGFNARKSLYNHKRVVHKGKLFKCPHCPNTYKGPTILRRHQITAHGTKEEREALLRKNKVSETCGICGRVFREKTSIVAHMELFHLQSKDLCPGGCELLEPFKNEEEWRHHLENCSSGKLGEPVTCFFCKAIFPNCLLRLHHQLQSHETYKCEHCQQSFTKPLTLQRHHCERNRQNFLCPKCGKSFLSMYNLDLHLTIVCNDDEASKKALAEKRKKKYLDFRKKSDKFKCSKCPKRFVNEKKLIEHLKTGHENDDENEDTT